jgi:hypothetical protein
MLRVTSSIRQADISTAQATPGLFTENCFVLAEGEMHAGVFKVTTLAKPSVRRALVGLPARPPARLARAAAAPWWCRLLWGSDCARVRALCVVRRFLLE